MKPCYRPERAFPGGGLFQCKTWLHAVDGISLSIQRARPKYRQESGSGKSTLGQAILRLLDSAGSIRFQARWTVSTRSNCGPGANRCRWCSRTFGSLESAGCPWRRSSARAWRSTASTAQECEAQVIQVLKEVGLDPQSRHRYPRVFRWPAPTHRHRPRPGAQAGADPARRTDLGAGPAPQTGGRPAPPAPGKHLFDEPVHQPADLSVVRALARSMT